MEELLISAPNLTGRAEMRAVAEAVVPVIEVDRLEEEELARELGVPDDLVGIDPYIISMYRRCLAGPHKEGTIRSQRERFGLFLDRPAGMPGIVAGQTWSDGPSRRGQYHVGDSFH